MMGSYFWSLDILIPLGELYPWIPTEWILKSLSCIAEGISYSDIRNIQPGTSIREKSAVVQRIENPVSFKNPNWRQVGYDSSSQVIRSIPDCLATAEVPTNPILRKVHLPRINHTSSFRSARQ